MRNDIVVNKHQYSKKALSYMFSLYSLESSKIIETIEIIDWLTVQ